MQEKLEEIRRQPEHIRMRYVFVCVFICMVFVLILFVVSLGQNFSQIGSDGVPQEVRETLDIEGARQEIENQKQNMEQFLRSQNGGVTQQLEERIPESQSSTPTVEENELQ